MTKAEDGNLHAVQIDLYFSLPLLTPLKKRGQPIPTIERAIVWERSWPWLLPSFLASATSTPERALRKAARKRRSGYWSRWWSLVNAPVPLAYLVLGGFRLPPINWAGVAAFTGAGVLTSFSGRFLLFAGGGRSRGGRGRRGRSGLPAGTPT